MPSFSNASYFCPMENEDLKSRICSLDDEALLELLQLRRSYREDAVAIALQEAKERGLISSEKDLEKPGVIPAKIHKKSLFPILDTENQFRKTVNSMARILYLFTVVPLGFGVLKLAENQMGPGILLLAGGIFWVISVIRLQKQKDPRMPIVLIFLFFAGVAFLLTGQPQRWSFQSKDLFVYGLLFFGLLYLLLYLRILLLRNKRQQ